MKPKGVLSDKFSNTSKNRTDFHRIAHQKIMHAKRYHRTIGLLLLNLDNFQSINNHHGHATGDLLLLETFKRLRACLGKDDFISRIDGDEFVIILGNLTSTNAAQSTIKKLLNCFRTSYLLKGASARIHTSIGVAYYPHAGKEGHALLQSAGICIMHAKSLGGNNCQFYTEKLRKKYKKESSLINALNFALENKELFVTYQPIFNLSTKEMVGMEALLRWRHPELGLISPDIFIGLAEKNGLITTIGEWAFQEVYKQAKQWYSSGFKHFKISFNISSNQLLQKSFSQAILRTLNNTPIPSHLFDIELTESAFLTYPSYFETILKKMAKTGIGITIDDFGTGHSSLLRLKNLPIRALKIDKTFVLNITPHSFNAIIVNSLIALGEKLGMNIIAEGIEAAEDLQFLIDNGCPQGQGYYLCKPLTAKQMTHFLEKNKK